MTNEDKDKKEYELGLLLKHEEDLGNIVKLVSQHNAEKIGEPRAKRLALSYEINGNTEATFAYFNFFAFGDDMKNLEHDLNSRQEVIRFLLVIATPPNEHRAPMGAPGMMGPGMAPRRGRPARPMPSSMDGSSSKGPAQPLSNEALEKKIEEILK